MATRLLTIELGPRTSLLLAELVEPSNNDLRIVVVEVGPEGEPIENEFFGLARQIQPRASSRAFELRWWNYVTYAVSAESYCSLKPGEEPEGVFGCKKTSPLLDYVGAATFASDDHPGPLRHWYVNTEWHCIGVVSNHAPEIRELAPTETRVAIENTRRMAAR